MLTTVDLSVLAGFEGRLSHTVEIGLTLTSDPRSRTLRQFCDDLAHHLTQLNVKVEKIEDDAPPAIRLTESLRYQAVPVGPELAPFLEALALLDQEPPTLPDRVLQHLDALQAPASVAVFIAPNCPHCPAAVRRLLPLAAAAGGVGIRLPLS